MQWAPGCAACRALAPRFDLVAAEFAGRVAVSTVNVAADPAVARRLGIGAVPTVVAFSGTREVNRLVGAVNRLQLRALFRQAESGLAAHIGMPASIRTMHIAAAAGLALAAWAAGASLLYAASAGVLVLAFRDRLVAVLGAGR